MNAVRHRFRLALLGALACASLAQGYDFIRKTPGGPVIYWNPGPIQIQVQVDDTTLLSDGMTRSGSIQNAMQMWNTPISSGNVQFTALVLSPAPGADHNGANQIFFTSSPYGASWDTNTLAVTTIWYNSTTLAHVESDILFNNVYTWDSYRGPRHPGVYDLQRVALHELGHVLGLDHPDMASPPQTVTAVMNSNVSDTDALQPDDMNGAIQLYTAAGSTPQFTAGPSNLNLIAGQAAYFRAQSSGYPVPAVRWQRLPFGTGTWADLADGGAYAATGTLTLAVNPISTAMSGDQFRCVASSNNGSATSSAASLNVTAATPPSFFSQPTYQTVVAGSNASFLVSVGGSAPISLRWQRLPAGSATWADLADGGSYSGTGVSSLTVTATTLAMSGDQFHCVATNGGGSVTSISAALTVTPPVAPMITLSATVSVNYGDQLYLYPSVGGTLPFTYQWYQDGTIIAGATGLSYIKSSSTLADSGVYTFTATNAGGSVSAFTTVTVMPAAMPQALTLPNTVNLSTNTTSFTLSPYITGTGPISYQWFKDGAVIPGATSSSYSVGNATSATAGTYALRMSNAVGMAMSPDMYITWLSNLSGPPWVDAVRLGDIVYILAASPGRIMRYDLTQESWLPMVLLTNGKVPTAFAPTAEGVFVAYGRDLVRRSPDLQTETPIVTASNIVNSLFAHGLFVYYVDGANIVTYDRASLAAGPASSYDPFYVGKVGVYRPAIATTSATGVSTRAGLPADVIQFHFAGDGTITSPMDSPYNGELSIGSRQYYSPDDSLLFDNSGVIYRTAGLTYFGSLGRSIDDLAFMGDGTPIALRGSLLTAHGGAGMAELGRYQLGAPASAVFAYNNAVFAFAAPVSNATNPPVTKLLRASFTLAVPAASGSPANKIVSQEFGFLDANKVIHFASRSERGIIRWDPKTGIFLPTLPLRGGWTYANYSPANDRMALAYSDGTLTNLFPGPDPTERAFGTVSVANSPFSLLALDELTFLNIQKAGSTGDLRIVLGPSGELKYLSGVSYFGAGQVWQSATRRLYSIAQFFSSTSTEMLSVPSSGSLDGTAATVQNVAAPLHFSADGTLVLSSNQRVLNADLQQVGTIANTVTDGAWLANALFTIRARPSGTEVQRWDSIFYNPTGSTLIPGAPLRIFAVDSNTVAAVTLVNGYLAFSLVSADLSLSSCFINAPAQAGAPQMTQQPVGQSATLGASVTLVAAASASGGLTYQWQKGGANIAGATNSSLTLTHVTRGDSGSYRVVVTTGTGVVFSSAASLAVNAPSSGDFNGDGRTDIFLTNSGTSERAIWLMNSMAISAGASLGVLPASWSISGEGDFNGDGKADVILTNTTTGDRAIWLMNGTAISAGVSLGVLATNWSIDGTADFNGDGKADLVLTNTVTGERVVWLLNGASISAGASLGVIPISWTINGTGDFDGDGKADIFLTNTATGERAVLLMNGAAIASGTSLGLLPTNWIVSGLGDFDDDGKTDIFLTNTGTGDRAIWLMNGAAIGSGRLIGNLSTAWFISRIGDFDGDGKADILLTNTTTGERAVWIMNGPAIAAGASLGIIANTWLITP